MTARTLVGKVALGTWRRLPVGVRQATLTQRVRARAATTLFAPGPNNQRVVRTLAELDVELQHLAELAELSDDALRAGFAQFRMELDLDWPADPWSDAYRDKVFELYEFLHGCPYAATNEVTELSVAEHADRPFPYSTASPATVGNQLIAVGHIIRTFDLAPGARVLELGPGWGNTTLAMAQMGYEVSVIDIEKRFVDLVQERAARVGATVHGYHGDFAMIEELAPGFDGVLFFESFHHAADHRAVLASLDRIVAPGGRVLFAGEPIDPGLPYPWGLRLDGESLWAIRKHGWLELGFRPAYFQQALARFGWSAQRVTCPETPWGVIYVARRSAES